MGGGCGVIGWRGRGDDLLAGVARRQVTFFCCAKRKVTKKKATLHPRIPEVLPTTCRVSGLVDGYAKSESAGRAAKELGLLLLIFKESRPQTPSPLIRPADSDFGGAERR